MFCTRIDFDRARGRGRGRPGTLDDETRAFLAEICRRGAIVGDGVVVCDAAGWLASRRADRIKAASRRTVSTA